MQSTTHFTCGRTLRIATYASIRKPRWFLMAHQRGSAVRLKESTQNRNAPCRSLTNTRELRAGSQDTWLRAPEWLRGHITKGSKDARSGNNRLTYPEPAPRRNHPRQRTGLGHAIVSRETPANRPRKESDKGGAKAAGKRKGASPNGEAPFWR